MTAVENVLDIAALVDPSKIIAKMKYHLLAHLKDNIIWFRPLVGITLEVFESFNAIFCYCSIYSNHLAPSHNIACQLSGQEALKRILSGEWWLNQGSGDCVSPEPSVWVFVNENNILKSLVSWLLRFFLCLWTIHSSTMWSNHVCGCAHLFTFLLYISDSFRLIFSSSPIMLDSYGLIVTLTFYQVWLHRLL